MKTIFKLAHIWTMLILLCGVQSLQAQKWQLPDSPTGRAATALLNVLDRPEEENVRQFVENHMDEGFQQMPFDEHLSFFEQMGTELEDIQLVGVNKTGPESAQLKVQSGTTGDGYVIRFHIEADPPHRINGLDIQRDEPRPYNNTTELDQYLEAETEAGRFSGVVFIARNGEATFHEAYGPASKRFNIPNQPDTRFNIGSINKDFTSVVILQLVQQGQLKLDDTIGQYLSDFPTDIADRVTVHHLLQHRSGWGHYWDNEYYLAHQSQLRTLDDYKAFIKDIPLQFEPGTKQQYSNVGFEVLGMLIEAVTGQSYHDYVREHIFEPVGMQDTEAYARDLPVQNLAMGYTRQNPDGSDGDVERENMYQMPPVGTAAGGGYSTADDLFAFFTALLDHRLINPSYTAFMLSGFEQLEDDPGPLSGGVGYAGGGPGVSAVVEMEFDSRDFVIVLSNYDPPVGERLGSQIMQMLRGS